MTTSNPEEADQLRNAYADVEQKVPEKKPTKGYVRMRLFATSTDKETIMAETLSTVSQLVSIGVEYRQIAILVRSNRTIQDIADYFMANSDYPLVSDEAFRLDASQAINTLVTALRLLTSPKMKSAGPCCVSLPCDSWVLKLLSTYSTNSAKHCSKCRSSTSPNDSSPSSSSER